MQINELAAVSSRIEIDYPVVSDTEKGFWVKAIISAHIKGRNFQYSGLGDSKTLSTATKKALESALALFEGIAFDSMPSLPQPIVQTPVPESQAQPQPLEESPVIPSKPEPVAQTSDSESQAQFVEETPIIASEPESVVQTSEPETQLQPLEETLVPETQPQLIAQTPVPESQAQPLEETLVPETQAQPLEETPKVDYLAESSKEISRLGWTAAQGKYYLQQKYQVVSRLFLKAEQLEEFYVYLKTLPTPEATPEVETLPVVPPTVAEAPASQPQSGASFDPSQLVKFDLKGEINFQQVITASNCAIKILGLTTEEAKAECMKLYGKRSRQLLSDEELIDYSNNLVDRAAAKMSTATVV